MNLRSGAVTLNFSAKAKPRRRQEIGEMEENIQKMLNELKSEITGQIGDFRTDFQELRVEIKKDFNALQNGRRRGEDKPGGGAR